MSVKATVEWVDTPESLSLTNRPTSEISRFPLAVRAICGSRALLWWDTLKKHRVYVGCTCTFAGCRVNVTLNVTAGMCECHWMRPRHELKTFATCFASTRQRRLAAWSHCSSCWLTGSKSTAGTASLYIFISPITDSSTNHYWESYTYTDWSFRYCSKHIVSSVYL